MLYTFVKEVVTMPKPKTAAAEYYPTMVRLPRDVWRALREAAKAGHRPLNTQVILVMREALNLPEPEEEGYPSRLTSPASEAAS
jgi:hypothetical protein